MLPNPQKITNLDTITKEILNGKLHFLWINAFDNLSKYFVQTISKFLIFFIKCKFFTLLTYFKLCIICTSFSFLIIKHNHLKNVIRSTENISINRNLKLIVDCSHMCGASLISSTPWARLVILHYFSFHYCHYFKSYYIEFNS